MTNPDPIVLEIREATAIIRFNRPRARNPLSSEVQTRLEQVLSEVTNRASIEVSIFTGTEGVFLSGADISELAALDCREALAFAQRGQHLCQLIAEAKPRTIAAINGYCLGGGLDLALACDLRIASPKAEFAHPGARLGIITGWGGTQRLSRLIGKTRAIEFFATARRFNSAEAMNIGLIDIVDDSPLDYALKISRSF